MSTPHRVSTAPSPSLSPIVLAVAAAALFAGLARTPVTTTTATTTTTTTTTAGNVVERLALEEAMLRIDVDARLRAGRPAPSGSDPLVLGVAGSSAVVQTRFGRRFLVDDAGSVRPIATDADLGAVIASPRFLAATRPALTADAVAVVGDTIISLRRLERRVLVQRDGASTSIPFEAGLFSLVARGAGGDDTGMAGVTIWVGGVENEPLDRSSGSFLHLDSFVYRLDVDAAGAVTHGAATNLSDVGVVTPKALAFDDDGTVLVAGAGSGTIARIDAISGAVVEVIDGLVGANDLVVFAWTKRAALASPIVDGVAFIDLGTGARVIVAVIDAERPRGSSLARLGEALVFSSALAPEQQSAGPLSRFTCEACHADGGVDGRVHRTGRFDDGGDEIATSTKPLRGLFQNPPLFTRAYDDSVAAMVHAEVGVANANSPRDRWTALVPTLEAPFLTDVLGDDAPLLKAAITPMMQRRAMLHFFAAYGPVDDAANNGDDGGGDDGVITPTSADWAVFDARCLRCHQARIFTDDATSVIEGAARERLWRSHSLVWASTERVDVGVHPLVRDGGGRASSLRGIAHKQPLLTNGSARDLGQLVRQIRVDDTMVWHDGPATRGAPLDDDEQAALLRVLSSL